MNGEGLTQLTHLTALVDTVPFGAVASLISRGSLAHVQVSLAVVESALHAWAADLATQPRALLIRLVASNRLGDLATNQGKLPDAERHFAAVLAIRPRLADSDPANADWKHDLSWSLTILVELH